MFLTRDKDLNRGWYLRELQLSSLAAQLSSLAARLSSLAAQLSSLAAQLSKEIESLNSRIFQRSTFKICQFLISVKMT
jgi:hypothetical protein